MSVEFYRESPGKFDSRTLNRTTLNRWTGRITIITITAISYNNILERITTTILLLLYLLLVITRSLIGILP